MLGLVEQAAVKAVLTDLVAGQRVPASQIDTLLGVSFEQLVKVAEAYPAVEGIDLEVFDLAIHNGLNLYVNGISVSEAEWEEIGSSQADVEKAFEQWQRTI